MDKYTIDETTHYFEDINEQTERRTKLWDQFKEYLVLPSGVYPVRSSGHDGGVSVYLKKKWWLRLYHIITFSDMSPYLLNTFNAPVSFNHYHKDVTERVHGEERVRDYTKLPDVVYKDRPEIVYGRGLYDALGNGYECHYSVETPSGRVLMDVRTSLSQLVWMPWHCRRNSRKIRIKMAERGAFPLPHDTDYRGAKKMMKIFNAYLENNNG